MQWGTSEQNFYSHMVTLPLPAKRRWSGQWSTASLSFFWIIDRGKTGLAHSALESLDGDNYGMTPRGKADKRRSHLVAEAELNLHPGKPLRLCKLSKLGTRPISSVKHGARRGCSTYNNYSNNKNKPSADWTMTFSSLPKHMKLYLFRV